jgi:tryptophanyl-tRNA synthetase
MKSSQAKKRVFSGIQPSGKLHIGNYVGALSLWGELQDVYESIFCVVDLHALTMPESTNPTKLHDQSRELAALYLACGIDPSKNAVFIQSHIHAHTELAWVLNCMTPVSWLEHMTQYKVKAKQSKSVSAGLLNYPVLQAADILLYQTDLVPVGEDQRQHIELTRDVAIRFNRMFGQVFVVPEIMTRKHGARIAALDDPRSKMSKSVGAQKSGHSIGLLDDPDTVRRTIMSATTDSGQETRFHYASPGILNLLVLYESLTNEERGSIETKFAGKGYDFLKKEVIDVVLATLQPVQARYHEIMSEPSYIETILRQGADRVRPLADQTMDEVRRVTGIGARRAWLKPRPRHVPESKSLEG